MSNVNEQVRDALDALGARFARIECVKKDGSIREMIVQRAKEKYEVTGGRPEATLARKVNHPELVNVWSVADQAFRSINVRRVMSITADGNYRRYRDYEEAVNG
jgi:hypothetical protein